MFVKSMLSEQLDLFHMLLKFQKKFLEKNFLYLVLFIWSLKIWDCAIIIRRGAEKLEGGGALHKIAAKIGGPQSKITHLTEGGGLKFYSKCKLN